MCSYGSFLCHSGFLPTSSLCHWVCGKSILAMVGTEQGDKQANTCPVENDMYSALGRLTTFLRPLHRYPVTMASTINPFSNQGHEAHRGELHLPGFSAKLSDWSGTVPHLYESPSTTYVFPQLLHWFSFNGELSGLRDRLLWADLRWCFVTTC